MIGVPDPMLGQAIKAVVALDPDADARRERDVIRHCAQHLEDFMVPKTVEFRAALPKTENGKINRRGIAADDTGAPPNEHARHRRAMHAPAILGATGSRSTRAPRPTRIADAMREQVLRHLQRRGIVLGLSGGIDSSVSAALAVRARSARRRCSACFMPERDSDPDSLRLGRTGRRHASASRRVIEDIAPIARRPPAATSAATTSSASSCRSSAPAGAARS